MKVCGEIRAPRPIFRFGGFLFLFLNAAGPDLSQDGGMKMDRKELAYGRHALTTLTDWDDFQRMIRVLVRIARGEVNYRPRKRD